MEVRRSRQRENSPHAFVSGGFGRVRCRESSPFAQATDDVETSSASYHVQGGLEIRLVKWVAVSGDLRYRWIPDLLGTGGVSAAFGEDDCGASTRVSV
jgi:hypothetical protein